MKALELKDRRELFVDDYLIDDMGKADLRLHSPQRQEIALVLDTNSAIYERVLYDDVTKRFLLYYHTGNMAPTAKNPVRNSNFRMMVTTSEDGIHWGEPQVVMDQTDVAAEPDIYIQGSPAHMTPFLDTNPACPPEERFKAVVVAQETLRLMVSPDGLKYTLRKDIPAFNIESRRDSQNMAFFDHNLGYYRIYHRVRHFGERAIRVHITPDFVDFRNSTDLVYNDTDSMAFYTNQIEPYFRAPHLLMGFPMRYEDRGQVWDRRMSYLPARETRLARIAADKYTRLGTVSTDTVFMCSRDGWHFTRYPEAFLRPGPSRATWMYGDNFLAAGMIPTKSTQGDTSPDELSFFAVERDEKNEGTEYLRRCTLRMDGFVSLHFPGRGARVLTKPFTFTGGALELNVATSAWGQLDIEITDQDGIPIPGFREENFYTIKADDIALRPEWEKTLSDLRSLEGKVIRLRLTGRDADLYSMKFVPWEKEPEIPEIPTKYELEMIMW